MQKRRGVTNYTYVMKSEYAKSLVVCLFLLFHLNGTEHRHILRAHMSRVNVCEVVSCPWQKCAVKDLMRARSNNQAAVEQHDGYTEKHEIKKGVERHRAAAITERCVCTN